MFGIWDHDPLFGGNSSSSSLISQGSIESLENSTSITATSTATATSASCDQINNLIMNRNNNSLLSRDHREHLEVTKPNILYFDSEKELASSLLSSAEHLSNVKLLTALVMKIKPLFPPPVSLYLETISSSSSSSSSPSSSSSSSIPPSLDPPPSTFSNSSCTALTHAELLEQVGLITILLSDIGHKRSDKRAAVRLVLAFLSDADPRSLSPTTTTSLSTSTPSSILAQKVVNEVETGRMESHRRDKIHSAFVEGPACADFISFLLSNCCLIPSDSIYPSLPPSTYPSPSPSLTTSNLVNLSDLNISNDRKRLNRNLHSVLQFILLAEEVETDEKILFNLLKATHTINNMLQSESKDGNVDKTEVYINDKSAAGYVLLSMFVFRPLTATRFVSYLIQEKNISFLFSILSDWMLEITSIGRHRGGCLNLKIDESETMTIKCNDDDSDNVNDEKVLLISCDLIRMFFHIALQIIVRDIDQLQCTYNTHSKYGTQNSFHSKPLDQKRNISYSAFINCAAWILSQSTGSSYSRKVLVPLISDVLCGLPPIEKFQQNDTIKYSFENSNKNGMNIPTENSHEKSVALLFSPIFDSLSAPLLLNLLLCGGGGIGVLVPSGISVECLKRIVDSIDADLLSSSLSERNPLSTSTSTSTVVSSSNSSSSTSSDISSQNNLKSSITAAWQSIIKPFNSKKILKIQCELQPLLSHIITLTLLMKNRINKRENGIKVNIKKQLKEDKDLLIEGFV